MTAVTFGEPGPMSSGEIYLVDPSKLTDIQRKHDRVTEYLQNHHYDGLLLQKPENFAWFTSGADSSRAGSSEAIAALFITPDARVIATSNADSGEIFDKTLPGLGFQLKERPWYEQRQQLLEDLCRGRTVASDTGIATTIDVSPQLKNMRLPLTVAEIDRVRELGAQVSHAVEATARAMKPHRTEAEIAGEVAHRLIKRGVVPERIQVGADGQFHRYPHWTFSSERSVSEFCTITAIGKKWGLCTGATRTVSLGEPSKKLKDNYQRTLLMQATGMYFSQPDWELFEIWNRVRRIYEKFDCSDQWQRFEQAEVIAFEVNEVPLVPKSQFRLATGMPVFWHPSVGSAVVGDTVLVGEKKFELLTPMEDWPRVSIEVKGTSIERPGILVIKNKKK